MNLLKSILERLVGAISNIAEEAQSPIDSDPSRCRLYGRCPHGQDRCVREAPPLLPFESGRLAACHFPHESHPA